ncbi:acyltransferase [Undibacterium sp. LFS511W]|uniref:Acyltransferase n=2 Tax=Undibacterium luofuense TaxID=2828733 RepID=A0A941DQM0_9BURK|nr:acyltransferase [Undibacterium luofuense]
MTPQTPHLSHPKYRPDIDGLRAIAVLSVVAFHAFPAWMKGGFIGVDVFFVISGFLISIIIYENLDKGTFSFAEFYARRIRRIFPALLLVLLASFTFGWFSLLADEYKQLGKHIAAGAGFVSNFVFWSEVGYFDNSVETKPLLHLWSLGIEEQFYIAWPFFLWLAWRPKFNLFALTVLVALVSFYLNLKGIKKDAVATFYSPQTRFWELLAGSILAWFALYKKDAFANYKLKIDGWPAKLIYREVVDIDRKILSNVASFVGCLLLAYGFWQITKDVSFPGKWAAIPVLGAMLIILAGPKAWINRKILSTKIAVWFGLISFPLYLWHWPILFFARIIVSEVPSRNIRMAAVVLSIVLAWLTYKFVERPVRLGKGGKAKVSIFFVLMALLGVLGYHTYIKDGYDTRNSIKGFVNNKNELLRTPASDEACLSYVDLKTPLFSYCRFTNVNSDETIAVIGDSHAHVAYPGISEFLASRGKNTVLLANSGCPPFLESPTGNNQNELDACANQVEQLLKVVESKKDIKKIFVFTRGPIYLTGTEPLSGDKKLGVSSFSLMQFVNSAQRSIDRLKSKDKTIFYVSENPELNFLPDSCLTRPFKVLAKSCAVSKESVYARQEEYRKSFSNLKNVTYIDSLPVFCPSDKCLIFDEKGSLLYADDDHLSVAGSRFQVNNLLKPYFD